MSCQPGDLTTNCFNCYDDFAMKKILYLLFVVSLVLVSPVLAQNDNSSDTEANATAVSVTPIVTQTKKDILRTQAEETVEEARATGTANREEAREQVEEKRAEMKEKRTENLKKRIDRLKRRLTLLHQRLAKLAERIDGRLTKLEGEGQDVTIQKGLLTQAKEELGTVPNKIAELDVVLDEVVASETPGDLFANVKTAVEEIQGVYSAVHSMYVDIITQIKGLKKEESSSPSVTPEGQ